jgi:hypothetical protein
MPCAQPSGAGKIQRLEKAEAGASWDVQGSCWQSADALCLSPGLLGTAHVHVNSFSCTCCLGLLCYVQALDGMSRGRYGHNDWQEMLSTLVAISVDCVTHTAFLPLVFAHAAIHDVLHVIKRVLPASCDSWQLATVPQKSSDAGSYACFDTERKCSLASSCRARAHQYEVAE